MRVMLSSSGAKVPLLQALRSAARRLDAKAQLVAADLASPVVSQYFADTFWQMPPCQEHYLPEIIAGLQQFQISHILPSRDGELMFWSGLKAHLASLGIKVLVASQNSIQRCLDKQLFADFLGQLALPAIPVYASLPGTAAESTLWVVKERFGAGSQSLGLALEPEAALRHAARLTAPIFQPYISGREVSIDAWLNNQGRLKAHIYRYRIKIEHGESQITQTVALPQYDQQISDVLQALQLTGPVVLQAIIDEQQQLHLIECNSRFGGASTLGIAAGVDSLYWSLAESCGQDINAIPFHPASAPLTQVRFAGDHYL